ncbi:HepT-like ribonuclease domain-containing protein [Acidithiobacillus concretivorus]|uniref:DUF86 domain-containing protein n=1 Tax=Acidithiobacillus concretivorus TaxID=3063952 RepID=A0ABS5ZUU8_9PROT|nr:DUF86 domain-containing protein [Acidithiobacillus concretivorus]MBU2739953.1 DUF86 domain-containing protein [Acidithiobacillus concretivorus]
MTHKPRLEDLRVEDFLEHIQASINRIFLYTESLSKQDFFSNAMAQDAVVRNFEIIGEAAHHVLDQCKDIVSKDDLAALKNAYRMRNVLVHGYFGVDHATVWDTIQADLPVLKQQIDKMIEEQDTVKKHALEALTDEEAPDIGDDFGR